MRSKAMFATVLALAVLGAAPAERAQAQQSTSGQGLFPKTNQSKSLADQIDGFTRQLLGLPPAGQSANASSQRTTGTTASQRSARGSAMSRAGSIVGRSPAPTQHTPSDYTPIVIDRGVPMEQTVASSSPVASEPDPMVLPLHERLERFREPIFRTDRVAEAPAASPAPRETASTTAPSHQPTTPAAHPHPAVETHTPTVAAHPTPASAVHEPSHGVVAPTSPVIGMEHPSQSAPTARPLIARQPTPAVRPEARETSPATAADPSPSSTIAQKPVVPATDRHPPSVAENNRPADSPKAGLLFSRKGPALSVDTVGPRQITVGKESTYEVTVQNRGEAGAEDVVVFVALPAWADVASAQASTGGTEPATAGLDGQPFRWQVGPLPAGGSEKIKLQIVPRESRPFDLAVRWDYRAVASQAMIDVREPKLAVGLDGPADVLFGEKAVYSLTVSNPGDGDADNVKIRLTPLGAGENQVVSHTLGRIAAGQKKVIEVELTARQVGDLTVKVEVAGDGGLRAELAEKVLVRRAALQVDVEGPNVQFVGKVATYRITVRNHGNAAAKALKLAATLPQGAECVTKVDGSRLDAAGRRIEWDLANLEADERRSFVVECQLDAAGANQIDVKCQAQGDLSASAGMTTRVEAAADLALEVLDPTGPIAVGAEAVYQVRVRNRGTKDAPNVQVVVYFSEGIEPVAAEGGPNEIQTGQVVFSPMATMAAGEDLLLKVTARAEVAGNHICRAEVHCRPLGTRLISEDTTQYYMDDTLARRAPQMATSGQEFAPADLPPSELRHPSAALPITASRPTDDTPRR